MGFFDWLLGDDENGGEMMEIHDAEGDEVHISKERYREEVLPKQLDQAADDPEALYQTIRMALDEGFAEESVEAAERLREIDDEPERGATILGLTYWKLGRLDEAEQVYRDYVDEHGESGIVLTNLAKVYRERGDFDRAAETLWAALELAPNLQNAVDMWASMHREEAGGDDQAYRSALLEAVGLPGAWYAKARLAHLCLELGEEERALELAAEVADEAAGERGVLMTLTGPLGEHDHVVEMVELFGGAFDPEVHNPLAGVNLARAAMETGNDELAGTLCEKLETFERPDIEEAVAEIRKSLD